MPRYRVEITNTFISVFYVDMKDAETPAQAHEIALGRTDPDDTITIDGNGNWKVFVDQELLAPKVIASCHTDDYRVVVEEFDATLWFATADDEDIQRLRNEEWCNSDIADTVAEEYAERNKQVAEMFTYLEIINSNRKGVTIGFECHVNGDEAMAWIRQHRPHLAAQWLLDEDDEPENAVELSGEKQQQAGDE